MMSLLRVYRIEIAVFVLAVAAVAVTMGSSSALSVAMLSVLEITFSFDNATVNAKFLGRLSTFWQRMFMTVGMVIAVLGMRLLFPFVVVCLAGHLSPGDAWTLALDNGPASQPGSYGAILQSAHPAIAAFGGAFLFLLFTEFVLDQERDVMWLGPLERPLQRLGRLDMMGVLAALILLLVARGIAPAHDQSTVLYAGVLGIVTYLAVSLIGELMENAEEHRAEEMGLGDDAPASGALLAGKAAFGMFLFLEVMDASFSFDGVIGAFAITSNPILVAIGLGVGALFVRQMTVHFVHTGLLSEVAYLEHGAMWAIGALSLTMLASITYDIPDVVSGLIGLCFIGAAYVTSRRLSAPTTS